MDATQNLVVPLEEARRIIEEQASRLQPGRVELLPLLGALGRILAEDVHADRDFPPFPRATRDGYALRTLDVQSVPAKLEVVAEIKAGDEPDFSLNARHAAEIMTGAPLPAGSDSVVMVEYCARDAEGVTVGRVVKKGDNVVPRGAEAQAGDVLLQRGHRIDHAAISVAAAVGKTELGVYVRPKIAILATGDELVELNEKPGPAQIRNSNSFSLAAQVLSAGADPVILPVAPDNRARLHELMGEGLAAELLIVSGGVSMGKYDLVEEVLRGYEAEFFFTGVQIQPGKPAVFGRARGGKYFLGLPGNPVSTMVTFELFARPLIDALCGAPVGKLRFVQARLKADIQVKTGLTRFLPALLSGEYHSTWVEVLPWKGSGDIAATARANCYVVVPRNRDHIFADEMVDVMV